MKKEVGIRMMITAIGLGVLSLMESDNLRLTVFIMICFGLLIWYFGKESEE